MCIRDSTDINPSCRVFVHDAFVLAENLVELYEACLEETGGHIDYVVDAIDTVSTCLLYTSRCV